MPVCTGQGDGPARHCCWIDGKICYYLTHDGTGLPRCSLLVELGTWDKVHKDRRWKRSIVGLWFKARYPGYGCGDWPQNIPEAMAAGRGLCCWNPPVIVEIT